MADTILICNTETISPERLGEIFSFVRILQPRALIVTFEDFLEKNTENKDPFDINTISSLYAYQVELFASRNQLKVIGQYGIDTYVYKSYLPINFSKLEQFFSEFPNEVFRMKAKCYNPSKQELYAVSQVGNSISVDTIQTSSWVSNVLFTRIISNIHYSGLTI
ncbi:GTP-binding protein [Bacillus sp. FJAT-45350]|uniref:GTP-binding protein n=1 Tax=Bacillus sp. FJAT-45350 TaxID=2011014 RepID=UPI000BB92F4A|nr:GTP-binding protein [Bacillus sp. FJAT-45350]